MDRKGSRSGHGVGWGYRRGGRASQTPKRRSSYGEDSAIAPCGRFMMSVFVGVGPSADMGALVGGCERGARYSLGHRGRP